MMQVMHTQEEFVLDFLNMFPPTGTLNARIIVSPSQMTNDDYTMNRVYETSNAGAQLIFVNNAVINYK
jgi:hypothetical protein